MQPSPGMESQGNIISRSTREGQWIHAFDGCKSLTSWWPSTSINWRGCMSLPYINIPVSISSTSNQAFGNCTALVKVVLHEGLQWIGKSAFLTCRSLLHSITIPSSVTGISKLHIISKNSTSWGPYKNWTWCICWLQLIASHWHPTLSHSHLGRCISWCAVYSGGIFFGGLESVKSHVRSLRGSDLHDSALVRTMYRVGK